MAENQGYLDCQDDPDALIDGAVACCSHCHDAPGGCEMCRHLFADKVLMLDWLQAPEDEDCRRYGCTATHIDGCQSPTEPYVGRKDVQHDDGTESAVDELTRMAQEDGFYD